MTIQEKEALHAQLANDIMEYYAAKDGIHHRTMAAKIVPIDMVEANNYNPNKMPLKEMQMLWECINLFGFLFPDIAWYDPEKGKYIIIDGFHRYESLRRKGKKYISLIELPINEDQRMILTVLMNRIKGMHQIEATAKLVVKLHNIGMDDIGIAKSLGMEAEEYIRLKQQLGIASYYKHHEYSKSWEIQE